MYLLRVAVVVGFFAVCCLLGWVLGMILKTAVLKRKAYGRYQ